MMNYGGEMNLQDFLGDTVYYLLIATLIMGNFYVMSLIWEIKMISTMG